MRFLDTDTKVSLSLSFSLSLSLPLSLSLSRRGNEHTKHSREKAAVFSRKDKKKITDISP
jgi:hypothetical protein